MFYNCADQSLDIFASMITVVFKYMKTSLKNKTPARIICLWHEFMEDSHGGEMTWWHLISSRECCFFFLDNTVEDLHCHVVKAEAIGIWDVCYRWKLATNKQHCLMGLVERHSA